MSAIDNIRKIRSWAEEDRPREKLMLKGKAVLTDAELLAILIASGTPEMSAVDLSKHILNSIDNNLHALAKLSIKDLMKFKGIGEAKAITITAALELGRRRKVKEAPQKTKITCSADAYELISPHLMDLSQEQFWIILLSRSNEVIRPCLISIGGVASTIVDAKIIFKIAIEALASSIILVHNHPSGSLMPSQEDKNLTQNLKNAGKLLETPIQDHLIFSEAGYFSFADEGIL